ncbi:mannose-6-phosphate isomerase-like protein (cupin superfamily) [Streptomyces sp. 3211.6]|uniref:cupin domain-containing protein n=1 Tax=Streptomyces TaxID=1883 RepID=UPI000CBB3876|nr:MULTISPECIES: cupin domain-containing protein [Streptomyces]RKT04575.1 mannose-6-phosphate isomerase-like protein (cupin superfamily) [Streptomyces sp. 3211.6]RPF40450.1 mannose-6-phosphate isomerase-like protein (cupin superfamily) [Streptomyces sp. Ag109_G2-6]
MPMHLISETEERTNRTPAGVAAGLAAPSQGSNEVCTWRVQMDPGFEAPLHLIDRDQVWMPIAGTFSFTVDGETQKASAGQAVVIPANASRQFQAIGETAQALVAMAAGGRAGVPGSDERHPLPWAL